MYKLISCWVFIIIVCLLFLGSLSFAQGQDSGWEKVHKEAMVKLEKAEKEAKAKELWEHLDTKTNILYKRGQYTEAVNVAKEALKVAEETFGSEHLKVAVSLNILAILYKTQGKYSEAVPLFNRALEIYEKTLGSDNPYVIASLNNLAEVYQKQGKHDEIEPLYKRALEINEKTLGKDHPDVATVLENMAALFEEIGKEEEAKELAERAKEIRSKYQ